MVKSIKEYMKYVSILQQQIDTLLQDERNNNYVMYLDEKDKELPDYDFHQTNEEIARLNDEILNIRSAINKANQDIKIGIEDYSISDGLIKIAQLNKNAERLKGLSSSKQKSSVSNFTGNYEYTEQLYDVKEAQKLYLEALEEIHALQTAIDKANIMNEIKV